MSEELCCFCKKVTMVNAPGDCQGMCTKCTAAYMKHLEAKPSLLSRLVYRVLKPIAQRQHVDTGGFDPYVGEVWTIKVLPSAKLWWLGPWYRRGIEVALSDVVSGTVRIYFFHKKEYFTSESDKIRWYWSFSSILWNLRYRLAPRRLFDRLMFKIFFSLFVALETTYQYEYNKNWGDFEDAYGSLSQYE